MYGSFFQSFFLKVRAWVQIFRKWAKNIEKGKIFENLGKNVQNLKIF